MMEFYDMEEVMTKLFGAIERKKHRDLDIYLQRTIESFDEDEVKNKINCPDWKNNGQLILHEAVKSSEPEILKIILRKVDILDVNVQDGQGLTPLHLAVRNQDLEMIRMLLAVNNCNPNIKDNLLDQTPAHMFLDGDEETLCQLVERSDPNIRCRSAQETLIHRLSYRSDSRSLSLLDWITDHSDVNVQNKEGETGLMIALERNNLEIADLLLAKGSDLFLLNKFRETALHIACRKNQVEMIKKMLTFKVCPLQIRDSFGNSPLHHTSARGFAEAADLLIHKGESPINMTNFMGETPLHLAVEGGFHDIVEMLVNEEDCNLEAITLDSFSVLDIAMLEVRERLQEKMTKTIQRAIEAKASSLTSSISSDFDIH